MARVLRAIGFALLREGAKHSLYKRGTVTLVVPRHAREIPTGTFHAILKQAGLSRDEYLRHR